MHLRRGNCEVMRYGLSKGVYPYQIATKSAPTLMNNAEIYYRGAAKLGLHSGAVEEEREALVKEAVMAKLSGNPNKLSSLLGRDKEMTLEIIQDMQDECLFSPDDLTILYQYATSDKL